MAEAAHQEIVEVLAVHTVEVSDHTILLAVVVVDVAVVAQIGEEVPVVSVVALAFACFDLVVEVYSIEEVVLAVPAVVHSYLD